MSEKTLASLRIDGQSDLLVTRYRWAEAVSRPFEATIELAAAGELAFDAVAMRPAHLSVRGLTAARHLHGIVARWEHLRTGHERTHYRATVVPRTHRMTLRQDMRIFQKKTAAEIARDVLLAAGLHADEFRLAVAREHPQRDYTVQYRETDHDFLHRILAREGIFYFYEHDADRCVLVLADYPGAHPTTPGLADGLLHDTGFSSSRERLTGLRGRGNLTPGKVTLRDFDPRRPTSPLQFDLGPDLEKDLEIYDFPGGYVEEGLPALPLGGALLGSRLGEIQRGRTGADGSSDCPLLTAGHVIPVRGTPTPDLDGEHIVVECVHEGQQPGVTQLDADEPGRYENSFACVPAGAAVPLPQPTAQPKIASIQSAIVVGPAGERVYTDELGRIKVQFHWDRKGKRDEQSSCWVRVIQPWGGHQHGLLSVPRIGAEVAVAFLEGDPDRPVVLGCLYSEDNALPHAMPTARTRTSLRSQSLPGSGYNELCFEDSGGDEQVLLRAERDLSVHVGQDAKMTVKRSAHATVEDTRTTRVGADNLTVDRTRNETIGGDALTKVGGTLVLDAGALILKVAQGVGIDSTGDLGLTSKGVLTIAAPAGICLQSNGNFITINSGGVFIHGSKIFLNSGGAPLNAAAPAEPAHDPPPTPEPADEP